MVIQFPTNTTNTSKHSFCSNSCWWCTNAHLLHKSNQQFSWRHLHSITNFIYLFLCWHMSSAGSLPLQNYTQSLKPFHIFVVFSCLGQAHQTPLSKFTALSVGTVFSLYILIRDNPLWHKHVIKDYDTLFYLMLDRMWYKNHNIFVADGLLTFPNLHVPYINTLSDSTDLTTTLISSTGMNQ